MTDLKTTLASTLAGRENALLSAVPDGMEPLVVADIVRAQIQQSGEEAGIKAVYISRDGGRLSGLAEGLKFFASEIEVVTLPGWDCLPYDRVSPSSAALAERMTALTRLARPESFVKPTVLLVSVNAVLQRMPNKESLRGKVLAAKPGNRLDMSKINDWLTGNGFERTTTVREAGEYAVRGGIIDYFAPGRKEPIRLDFFGDTLESIRSFDPDSQRTVAQKKRFALFPMSEVQLTNATIKKFRENYVRAFGAASPNDALYQSISEGKRFAGMEHWLPFFHDYLETLADFCPDATIVLDHLADDAAKERYDQIVDHYKSRTNDLEETLGESVPYNPVEPTSLYIPPNEWEALFERQGVLQVSPFNTIEQDRIVHDLGGKQGRTFAAERSAEGANVFQAVADFLNSKKGKVRHRAIACWTKGSADRMAQVLKDHGLENTEICSTWAEFTALGDGQIGLVILGLETGFETDDLLIVAEQDILGDRLVRKKGRSRRGSNFLTEVTSLSAGDLVVHIEHGIGRFIGLKTIDAAGAPHDCLELEYAGGDRLFLPVENIELLSRYGTISEDTTPPLDRLGGTAWQSRKAKLKKRLLDMADKLIEIAAARALKTAPRLTAPEGVYDEFAARFPYEETDDQLTAIDAVMGDLTKGLPMDRLVCGDVGFGKTEVALRGAFLAAMNGTQVAVVVPTTLLARQHYKTFKERFAGFPIRVEQASRLVGPKALRETKEGLKTGEVDIVVGTHALLSQSIEFRDLGLLIVDEEQRFGVKHKERLKELKADVHVLTLSATPIPRTLQLALTGVRELSLITTAPVDRLAVRTFVMPFDGLVIREALLRERYRGGQSFYVCPRISDIHSVKEFLDEKVPELKVAIAHGQMPPTELEDIMTAFYESQYDVLLSTTIVESGLDVPRANTMIVHRSDLFGLAQLYQIRGRVGRSKTRAYALLTHSANKILTKTAERRLKVLQSLDTLGAGFQLASHDLDIRGSGNLLGEEQSGHVKEVGFELYQQMLEEAVAQLKEGEDVAEDKWAPQITVGTPVLIPENYVPDLNLRLSLYRRLSDLSDAQEIDSLGAEMIDRFGPLPDEVDHLLKIVYLKSLCRIANVEKVDAGPKGVVLTLRNNEFPNPAGLVRYIGEQGTLAKMKSDHRIVILRDWPVPIKRLTGSAVILSQLAKIAEEAPKS